MKNLVNSNLNLLLSQISRGVNLEADYNLSKQGCNLHLGQDIAVAKITSTARRYENLFNSNLYLLLSQISRWVI